MQKRNYKELFQAGNKAQLEKLQRNEHKKGWNDLRVGYLTNRIDDELEELFKETISMPRDYRKIRHEAADIANFAHMIILRCDKELKK